MFCLVSEHSTSFFHRYRRRPHFHSIFCTFFNYFQASSMIDEGSQPIAYSFFNALIQTSFFWYNDYNICMYIFCCSIIFSFDSIPYRRSRKEKHNNSIKMNERLRRNCGRRKFNFDESA